MAGRHFHSVNELNNACSNDALGIDEAQWVRSNTTKIRSQYRIEAALSSFLDIVDSVVLYSSPYTLPKERDPSSMARDTDTLTLT